MFFPTASEVSVLKTILELSKNNSVYIEESEIFEKVATEIMNQVQNDGNCAQNDGTFAQKDNGSGLRTFKNALSGCDAKGFVQKSEQGEKSFYKITEEGFKQI